MSGIKIGSLVRSFDFPHCRDVDGENACYVVGTVESIGRVPEMGDDCDRYSLSVVRQVWCGQDCNVEDKLVFVPVNGTRRTMGGVCNGVELVS